MTTVSTTNSKQPKTIVLPWRWVIAGAVLLIILGIGAVLTLNILRNEPPTQIWPGQLLARDLARSTTQYPGVQLSSGVYLPDSGVILYSRVDFSTDEQVQIWAAGQLKAQVSRLEQMPRAESLTWIIDYGTDPIYQKVLQTPLASAADTSTHTYFTLPPDSPALTAPLPVNPSPVEVQAEMPVEVIEPAVAETVAEEPVLVENEPAPSEQRTEPEPAIEKDVVTGGNVAAIIGSGAPAFVSSFESNAADWVPLAGEWLVQDGRYLQSDATGFDYITMLEAAPLSHYSLEARFHHLDGNLGAGVIYNAPDINSRAGAGIVDFTDEGSFLRWGYYDEAGSYTYQGGVVIDPPVDDGSWHTLRLVTHQAISTIYLDEQEISAIQNQNQGGHVGLITSQARVEFDDVALLSIPASGQELPLLEIPLAQFEDNFADGEADGWQPLSGDWQVLDSEYHQLNLEAANLSSISPFHGDAYTVQGKIRPIEGQMEAGFYFNMSQPDNLAQSQRVGLTAQGDALQWGHLDEAGDFVPEGEAEIPAIADGAWYTLQITVADGQVAIILNDQLVAENLPLTYTSGHVGLYAGNGHVAFDDILMTLTNPDQVTE